MIEEAWAVKILVGGCWCWLKSDHEMSTDAWRRGLWPEKVGAKGTLDCARATGYLRKDGAARLVRVRRFAGGAYEQGQMDARDSMLAANNKLIADVRSLALDEAEKAVLDLGVCGGWSVACANAIAALKEYCGCRVEPRERCKVCRGTTFGTTFTASAPAVRTCNGCGAEAPRPSPRQSDERPKEGT